MTKRTTKTAVGSGLSGAQAPILPEPEPNVRRSARALVPILADGTLYLPGTSNEMVPLTFEAYGELVAARLIEPIEWDALSLVEGPLNEAESGAI